MSISTARGSGITVHVRNSVGLMLAVLLLLPGAAVPQSPVAVNLGSSGNFAILTKTGISTTGTTEIIGAIGVSPIFATAITGFGLIADPSGTFSSSSLVAGNVYAADDTDPTPTMLTTAVGDMEAAYTDAAGRLLPDHTELYAGDVTGQTLTPGLYKWRTGVLVSAGGSVTISGDASDVWIFQIAGTLTVGNGAVVTLSGGALASNIFWQVADQTILGTTSEFKGIILCQTLIEMQTDATLDGRALARTAVTLGGNIITSPSGVTAVGTGPAAETFILLQNYPNPFNPSTTIQYRVEKAGMVSLRLYNILGVEIATLVDARQEAGSYDVDLNATGSSLSLTSGIYFYGLETGASRSIRKLVLLR